MIDKNSHALEAIETKITKKETEEIKSFFSEKRDYVINLVNDYLEKNCVHFKKEDKKEEFKKETNEKFESLFSIIQPDTNTKTNISETNYSNGIGPFNFSYGLSNFSSSS